MDRARLIKFVIVFISTGLAGLSAAGLIPVSQETILGLTNLASLAIGGAYINAKQ